MTEQKNALAQLFAACWKDEALKARFMADPKAVLKEHGLDVPDNMDVKVVENADDCVHITLPAPPDGDRELSDDEIILAAGGGPRRPGGRRGWHGPGGHGMTGSNGHAGPGGNGC